MPGAGSSGGKFALPSVRGALLHVAAAVRQPGGVVGPPAARHRLGLGQPFAVIGRVAGREPVGRLRVGRRVDQGGDVPAGGEHEPDVAAEQLGGTVGRRPGHDMVVDACHHVAVDVDLGQIDGGTEQAGGTRLGQRVGHGDLDEVAVQPGGHPGGVGVPVQDVERRRGLSLQVVVDPVVPDQVVGPEPGEHFGEGAPVHVAAGAGGEDGRLSGALVHQRDCRARL